MRMQSSVCYRRRMLDHKVSGFCVPRGGGCLFGTDKALLSEKDLHDYQQFCVDFVEDKPQCALFLDCGLGKTVIALTAISHLLYDSFEEIKERVLHL